MNVYLFAVAATLAALILWRNVRRRRLLRSLDPDNPWAGFFRDMREHDGFMYATMLGTLCLGQGWMFALLAGMDPGATGLSFAVALGSILIFGSIAHLAAQRAANRREILPLLAPSGAVTAYGLGLGILFGGTSLPLPL